MIGGSALKEAAGLYQSPMEKVKARLKAAEEAYASAESELIEARREMKDEERAWMKQYWPKLGR